MPLLNGLFPRPRVCLRGCRRVSAALRLLAVAGIAGTQGAADDLPTWGAGTPTGVCRGVPVTPLWANAHRAGLTDVLMGAPLPAWGFP